MPVSVSRIWTLIGLAIALFGLPAIVSGFHFFGDEPTTTTKLARELSILGLTVGLLWIILTREKLPLSSIGIRHDRIWRSLAWGIGLTIVIFAMLVGCLALYGAFGISYGNGEGSAISPSLWLTMLTVIRAGVSEEIFYRGFAFERLQTLTGSKWVAAAVTLAIFAGFHYRQGLAGVFLALLLGAIITGFYLWKRNLVAALFAHFLVDFLPNVLLPLLYKENMA